MFKGRPVRWVSALQTRYATAAPVLMLNWNTLIPYFLRGEDQRETPPKPSATQHRTLNMFLDSTLQLVCKDRSRNGILVKSMTGF